MMAPFAVLNEWGSMAQYIAALLIGVVFGFFLERGGLGNSRTMALFFYLRNMNVLKVLFGAIVIGMTGIVIMNSLGWMEYENIYIPPTFLYPMMLGGAIMGVGFAVGSYCPGTSVVGMATLKIDAFFFYGGLIIGIIIFGETAPLYEGFFNSGDMGTLMLPQLLGLNQWVVWALVTAMAGGMFFLGGIAEKKFSGK
jgi:hypothetical protein